jgi:hypothetical protein
MPKQDEHDKPENLVESPGQEEQEARSLEDAVDSHGTLEGFYAMNNIRDEEEREALELEKKKRPETKKPETGSGTP